MKPIRMSCRLAAGILAIGLISCTSAPESTPPPAAEEPLVETAEALATNIGTAEVPATDVEEPEVPKLEIETLTVPGGTKVKIEHEVITHYVPYMQAVWPRALEALKALCEAS